MLLASLNVRRAQFSFRSSARARLALAARGIAYGERIEYSGPVYKSIKVKDGKVVEHWDVMQEEVPASATASGNPMFGPA